MDGVFPVLTPYAKKPLNLYSRNPIEEQRNIHLNYSRSASTSNSWHTCSPPVKSNTPQRVPRKPVVHNPVLKGPSHELPLKKWKSPPSPKHYNKNYAAADTVHPNRMRTYSQVTPIKSNILVHSTSPAILSNSERRIRTRRHSQGSHIISSYAPKNMPFTAENNENDDDQSTTIRSSSSSSNSSSSNGSSKLTITATSVGSNSQSTTTFNTSSGKSTLSSISSSGSNKSTTTFWYPRTESQTEPLQPLKRGLSKKLRGLLQPHRTQIEDSTAKEQHAKDSQASLQRCQSPTLSYSDNPLSVLTHYNMQTNECQVDFSHVDNYASTVQQRGPLLTPTLLSQKFLVRPYRQDLFRLRALFIWVIQNIRPTYHQRRHDLLLLQLQEMHIQQQETIPIAPSKSSNLRHRLSRMALTEDATEAPSQKLDAMHLLEKEATLLLAETTSSSDFMEETADDVLEKRSCKSAFSMAHLFVTMALAAGFEEAQVIYGYLKAPTDTVSTLERKLPLNHAWCSVKINGEYRMIDCWLASPFHPQNDSKMESHWFLTQPVDMILTHFPKHHSNQYLDHSISSLSFFRLPYVRLPFFWHRMHVLSYYTELDREDGIFYIVLQLSEQSISCYAETESDDGTCTRGLAQCLTDDHDKRICKIKTVLAPQQTGGWIKIYAGPKATPVSTHPTLEPVSKHHYPLALCVRIETSVPLEQPFDFVRLYVDHNEFYIQQPQCHRLYPLQTYHFVIRANRLEYRTATHHKLAIKSPSGKLVKLMYYPQDQTYDGSVTVSEAGQYSMVCLLHHTGASYTVATWSCSPIK